MLYCTFAFSLAGSVLQLHTSLCADVHSLIAMCALPTSLHHEFSVSCSEAHSLMQHLHDSAVPAWSPFPPLP